MTKRNRTPRTPRSSHPRRLQAREIASARGGLTLYADDGWFITGYPDDGWFSIGYVDDGLFIKR